MQRIELIGHLGNDAEVKDLGNTQVINFSVAVSESYTKNGEKQTITTWFECARWTNNTQIAQYLKKGTQVFLSGKVNNRAWQKEDGTLVVVNGINVSIIELLGSKKENTTNDQPKENINENNSNPGNQEEHDDTPF